ncbi:hypothetical protein H7H48_15950 [Nitratireductor sp. B36]|uniref:hypothetical protein n=1 Tax=Nitratireductor sp. B36 TaxID=2762059 RepID=UPI001E3DD9C4|nr:hypothetical protein [Nitratireductor sp. B36]MCC5780555.1 hypothetical protein [Nitratireductor sp. B36]
MSKTVWVVYGTTESGDDWMFVLDSKPSDKDIKERIEATDWIREEWDAGCIQGWTVDEHEVVQTTAEDIVTITKKEYESLLDAQKWRNCLQGGGVDNWEWYHDSLKEGGYFEDDEED